MTSAAPPQASLAFGVILLGAGASSRMGRPKLLLPWGRTSVVGHLIAQWRALGAEQIAIVCAPGDLRLQAELDFVGLPQHDRIENPEPGRGMFSSVLCAASWNGWKTGLTHWAIVLGDQPQLQQGTLRALVDFQAGHPNAICRPSYGGHARHPVLLPRGALDELRQSNAPSLRDFLDANSSPRAEVPLEDGGLALDLDRPEDYEIAVKLSLSRT